MNWNDVEGKWKQNDRQGARRSGQADDDLISRVITGQDQLVAASRSVTASPMDEAERRSRRGRRM